MKQYVTFRQLVATCTTSAAVAVVLCWTLTRADVWALKSAITAVSNEVRDLRINQQQTVNLGYDRTPIVGQIAQRILEGEKARELHSRTMRGTQGDAAGPAGGVDCDPSGGGVDTGID